MKSLYEILKLAIDKSASDVLVTVGVPVAYRINGSYIFLDDTILKPEDTETYVKQVLTDSFDKLKKAKEVDIGVNVDGHSLRVGAYIQRGYYAASFRVLSNVIRTVDELGLPKEVKELCERTSGLLLITGATGNGKSTTMAAMIDYINSTRRCHIVTVEDPIEYDHTHKKSIVTQKQVGRDTDSFDSALRAILREDPDVICIGEMRDLETVRMAITAAETGHLVISTLHTINAANTVDRIIDVFPESQQTQIRTQLSMVLVGIISQRLIAKADGSGRALACELALFTPALRTLIRTNKSHLITSQISLSRGAGMITMEKSIEELIKKGVISSDAQAWNKDA